MRNEESPKTVADPNGRECVFCTPPSAASLSHEAAVRKARIE